MATDGDSLSSRKIIGDASTPRVKASFSGICRPVFAEIEAKFPPKLALPASSRRRLSRPVESLRDASAANGEVRVDNRTANGLQNSVSKVHPLVADINRLGLSPFFFASFLRGFRALARHSTFSCASSWFHRPTSLATSNGPSFILHGSDACRDTIVRRASPISRRIAGSCRGTARGSAAVDGPNGRRGGLPRVAPGWNRSRNAVSWTRDGTTNS